jgi:hypothetical protein
MGCPPKSTRTAFNCLYPPPQLRLYRSDNLYIRLYCNPTRFDHI